MQTVWARLRRMLVVSALCILTCAFAASGCAKAQAKAAPEGPPLKVPTPPSRVLAPVEEPVAENPPPPEPAAPPPPTTTRPAQPTPPRRPPPTATTTEPEPKPEPPAAQPAPTPEPPVARPAPTQADAAADRSVRTVLQKAAVDLKKVEPQKLSADGRAQYEQSKRLYDQAEQALKDRNYAYAATVADKAAAMAAELLRR